MTLDELRKIMPYSAGRAALYVQPLTDAMTEFSVSTQQRRAAFLAQIAVESGELRYVEELASGRLYEGRVDLGNTQPGDGITYKGRGLIQITGRANYGACGQALGLDLLHTPSLLTTPVNAARSACWFWANHGLNELADYDDEEHFKDITRRINGGYNGLAERLDYWHTARRAEVLSP